MADPVTIGVVVASVLGMAGEAIVKGAVGEAVKDSYKALKGKIAHWASSDVEALEKAPTSAARRAVVAEIIDAQPAGEVAALRALAEQLILALKACKSSDIAGLRVLENSFNNAIVAGGSAAGVGNVVHNVTIASQPAKNR